ncbi:site-specific integrase [Desertivirga xinjiangensis]|uniref:site-specific integrase n=1 Tax=Desertivirga xinjiangensis TaxID=539206 RepID=UPI00210A0EF3|nr:site-specific integrase [Pedobacter xinjiangensis]
MSTTIKAVVLGHHKKGDGTYNVKIRITHQRVSRYLNTNHYVTDKQLKKDLSIKDNILLMNLDKIINGYRRKISEIEDRLDYFDCKSLVEFLKTADEKIDIISFGRSYIDELKKSGRTGSAANIGKVVNSLEDYFGRDKISITEITAKMLENYERFLRSDRELIRKHQNKKEFKIQSKGLSDAGLHNHMRDLRLLFNVIRDRFNDEDLGIIKVAHYPFKKYKIKPPAETRKRNLDIDAILKIRDHNTEDKDSRVTLARDLFVLSFYLCGINSVDLYYLNESDLNNGRLEYNRSKTKGKRKDGAFISIKVIAEAEPILSKYLGKLSSRYSTASGLATALGFGMRKLQEQLNISEVTFYWARHSFATIARNKCRKSKDDIALALNHVDEGRKTTDIYIEKDWKIVDEVQEAVVELLKLSTRSA